MNRLFKIIILSLISLHSAGAAANQISVFGDVLNWRASEQTAALWATVITIPADNLIDIEEKNIKFRQNLGYRGGVVYNADCDAWDASLYWTYFPSKAQKNISSATQIITPEFFSGFLSGNFFFSASLDWQLKMNTLDFELGRTFYILDSLEVHPAVGIKTGTIHQNINALWNAAIFTSTENVIHNFSGLGPSFGINCYWLISDSFSLFGDLSAAFLWGHWKIQDTYTRPSALFGLVTPTTITTTTNKASLGTLMLRYRLGVEWSFQSLSNLVFQLGYEMQFWPNQLRMPTFQLLPVHGDLTIHGAICRINLNF